MPAAKKTVAKKVTPKEEDKKVEKEETPVEKKKKQLYYRGEEVLTAENRIINGRLHVEIRTSTQTTLVSPDEFKVISKQ